ncbi:E3 SUMO-protein ligase PIAS2-like isoform X2 [Artemia franciscana]|uniref:E3 SUMO-protein ligase PIAS2-like isoform X2 n=1 Tax=Artemia franciscana TaxID=6661 RepID=UPI0032DB98D3
MDKNGVMEYQVICLEEGGTVILQKIEVSEPDTLSSKMSDQELRSMVLAFRVSELTMLLSFGGKSSAGRKQDLQQRALDVIKMKNPAINAKIKEIYKARNLETSALGGQNTYSKTQSHGGQSAASEFLTQTDVKLKKLPFYDVLAELIKPSGLVPSSVDRFQEGLVQFSLTPQQATEIVSSRDLRKSDSYPVQIQIRFALFETTSEQDDCFPSNTGVKVNGKAVQLPNPIPTNKSGVEPKRPPRPVDISPYCNLSPIGSNSITVSWTPEMYKNYVVAAYVVRKLSSQDLLQRMHKKGPWPIDYTKGLIKDKLKVDRDSEIALTSLRVSVNCPLGKVRMAIPCRPTTCSHLQCFDASLFLQMNERKPTWMCPVCDKTILYDNLVIDGYFTKVLDSRLLPSDFTEVEMKIDGSWEPKIICGKPNFRSTDTDKQIFDLEDVEEVSVVKAAPAATVGTEVKTKHVEEVLLIDSDSDETGTHASSAISAIHSANRPTTPALPLAPESSMVRPSSPDIIVLD